MKSLVKRWWFWLLVVVVVVVVVVHTYLALWVRDYVNRKLSEIPGYRAHVAAVTLHLWRGAYQIHNIDIKKTSGKVPVPFFSAPLVDLSVQWHALIFEGAAVGNIEIYRGKLNFVNGPTPEVRATEVDAPWAQRSNNYIRLRSIDSRYTMASFIIAISVKSRKSTCPLTTWRWSRSISPTARNSPRV